MSDIYIENVLNAVLGLHYQSGEILHEVRNLVCVLSVVSIIIFFVNPTQNIN